MNYSTINNNIHKYVFNKNKFTLNDFSNTLINKDLNYCKEYSIKNKKAGFNFYGNKNLCYLYKNSKPSSKFNNNLIHNYSIQKFVKNNKQKYAGINDQNNNNFYFTELNHFDLQSTDLIKKKTVENLDDCQNSCLSTNGCNSITYFQEPYKCNFYKNVNLNKNKNNTYDTYSLKSTDNAEENINNDKYDKYKNEDKDEPKKKDNYVIHKKSYYDDNKYTSCFTKEEHKDYNKLLNNYNNICKKELGSEYVFSNNVNNKNIIKCDNNGVKILCKPKFIENFNNKNNFYDLQKYIILIIFIILTFIVLFLKK